MLFLFFLSALTKSTKKERDGIPTEIKVGDHKVFCYFNEKTQTVVISRREEGKPAIIEAGKLSITSPTIEQSRRTMRISGIGPKAFAGSEVTSVKITVPLDFIAESAFKGCDKLTEVNLEGTTLTTISESCFMDCKALQSITLPSSIKSIEDLAFSSTNLDKITFPASLETIGNDAFQYTPIKKLSLVGTAIKEIGLHSFFNCSQLKEIEFPKSLTKISRSALSDTGLTEIKLPAGIKVIGKSAFAYNSHLTTADLSETKIERLEEFIFTRCSQLKTIKLPSTITSIGACALSETDLTEFVVPGTITELGQGLFRNCPRLTTIDFSKCKVTNIPVAMLTKCSALAKIEFPTNCKKIEKLAFAYSGISQIELPATLVEIEQGAFCNCSFLTSIDLSQSKLEKVGKMTFSGCTSLKTVTFPDKAPSYGDFAFANTAFTKLAIGNEITSAGKGLYANCRKLESVDLTNIALESVPASTFENCSMLKTIKLPEYSLGLGARSFYGTAITEIEFPLETAFIAPYAFANCHELERVSLTSSIIEYLSEFVFANCSKLENFEFPSSQIVARKGCLSGTAIKNVKIPQTLSVLSEYMFRGCKELTSVDLSEVALEVLPKGIFQDCISLKEITWPSHNFTIGVESFANSGFEVLTFPPLLGKISPFSFARCEKLKKVDMSSNGLNIPTNCFTDSILLSEIQWPSNDIHIGSYAFKNTGFRTFQFSEKIKGAGIGMLQDCLELTTLDLSKCSMELLPEKICIGCELLSNINVQQGSLREIGDYAFTNCTGIKVFTFGGSLRKLGRGVFANTSLTNIVVPSNIAEIENYCFANCSQLESVNLNESTVALICHRCFVNTPKLTKFIFPSDSCSILSWAFENSGFVRLVIPKQVTYIAPHVFEGCKNLVSIDISNLVMTRIHQGMFTNCTSLTHFKLAKWTTEICREAFRGTALTELTLEGVTFVEPGCFQDCKELITVDLSKTQLTNISARTFMNCRNLVRVILPDCVLQLHTRCFALTRIQSFKAPRSLVVLGAGVFENTTLTTYEIRNVQEIGDSCFEGCPIERLTFPRVMFRIGNRAFARTKLTDITLPANAYELGDEAFAYTNARVVDMQQSQIEEVLLSAFAGTEVQRIVLPNSLRYIDGEALTARIFFCGDGPVEGRIKGASELLVYRNNAKVIKGMKGTEIDVCPEPLGKADGGR
jgi:Leucine-rich repeat (LRR) protein